MACTALFACFVPFAAEAAPDPVLAPLLSAGATLLPIGVTAGLWAGGRGTEEGIRFDVGLTFLGIGAIFGPSVGQIYAQGGGDAWVSFILRAITGSIMLTGIGLWARADDTGVQSAGQALAIVSGIPTVFLAVYDTIGASSSAIEAARKSGHGRVAMEVRTDFEEIQGLALCSSLVGQPCPRF